MKIVNGSSKSQDTAPPVPASTTIVEKIVEKRVAVPASGTPADLEPLKAQMLSEVKRLETMIQQTHEETVKLAQVINELRMAMVELPATLVKTAAVEPAPAPAAAAAPAPEPVLAVEPLVKLDAVASPPAPPAETPKKLESSPPADVQTPKTKVAIFGKLWDYLNETERERPVRKSDRTN